VSDAPDDLDVAAEIEPIESADDGDTGAAAPRKRVDKGLLAACFVIAAGLALIAWGVGSALTGTDGIDRPDEIEEISPVENAIQVLQQGNIMVDLEFGYEAVLVIDGIELETSRLGEVRDDIEPGQQQTTDPTTAVFDPGNARISFQPSEGAPIEEFTEGRHNAQVIYWRIEDGRENGARSYRWSFDVI
jgi:hypothetical protein